MNRIIFATQNHHKVQEISAILHPDINLVSLADLGFLEELLETGSTLDENAIQKAEQVWAYYKMPCISEDTGLFVNASKKTISFLFIQYYSKNYWITTIDQPISKRVFATKILLRPNYSTAD